MIMSKPSLAELPEMDPMQADLLSESLIVTCTDDKEIGLDSKLNCHLMTNIDTGLLHRAFSLFIFSHGKLLLQQRSSCKVTFPTYWTNTCCSHPLYNPREREIKLQMGVRRAVIRKVEQELGILEISTQDLHYLTRIHYLAPSDDLWGEHEIDYIFIYVAPEVLLYPFAYDNPEIQFPKTTADNNQDVSFCVLEPANEYNQNVPPHDQWQVPSSHQHIDFSDTTLLKSRINPNEVMDIKYVSQSELLHVLETEHVTPWLRLICKVFLFEWWDSLDDLTRFEDGKIHRL